MFLDYDVVECTRQNWIDPGRYSECFCFLNARFFNGPSAAAEHVCGLTGCWEWEMMHI